MLNIGKIVGKFIKNSSQRELDRLKVTIEKINVNATIQPIFRIYFFEKSFL